MSSHSDIEPRAAIAGDHDDASYAALQPLLQALHERFGGSLTALLYYGSCWRNGKPYDGLNDFYVIVDGYWRAHGKPMTALANWLLPPNVYYLERNTSAGTLRAKYAVLSLPQFEAGARRWFNPCVWGRFAQPAAIVYAHNDDSRQRVQAALDQCVVSLLDRALPALPADLGATDAFARALVLSYRSELRVESNSQADKLITGLEDEYARRAQAAAPLLRFPARVQGGRLLTRISAGRRLQARLAWPLRTAQGKLLSLLRLAKACFTFTDAIDYGVWKLERHTGVSIEVTERLRRHPLIFVWPLLWRLYRQGVLR